MHDRALQTRVREIADELSILRLNMPSSVSALLPAMNELLEFESFGLYSLRSRAGHWLIDRWHALGTFRDAEARSRRMFERHREFPLFYNPHRPPKSHRNRVIDSFAWIEAKHPGEWEQSVAFREVFWPHCLHRHRQPRVLLCDGPELLGWFGGLHPMPATPQQRRLLAAFSEPMRRRLAAERRIEASHLRHTLDALIERIGAPAFVIDVRGCVYETNVSGRVLLDERRADVVAAFRDVVAGRASALRFELLELREHGAARTWLAILKPDTVEPRIDACVQAARQRLGLTPRQTEVLAFIVRGKANATIAALLDCVERTVELHVTALLDRFGVDSRAALVAATLMQA